MQNGTNSSMHYKVVKNNQSVYLVWCLSMKFTDTDNKNLGTANRQSDHYLAFTWVSLFHFSPLDQGGIASNLDKHLVLAFRSMRVTWFCLISHICRRQGSCRDNQCLGETIAIILQKIMDCWRESTSKSRHI